MIEKAGMDVLVAGGSGFIGRALCRVLVDRGHEVTAASRTPDADGLPAAVETAVADVSESDLEELVDGHDAVVNLVALPSHVQSRGQSHEAVHFEGTRHLVAAAERTGVERFVQLSGLGVESGVDTAYFRAKRRAERVVRDADLEWVIYRPSVVFGDGCAFIPFIERISPPLATLLPGGERTWLQPIWVDDLAPMLADGLENDRHIGQCYEIGGPERLTLAETVSRIRGGEPSCRSRWGWPRSRRSSSTPSPGSRSAATSIACWGWTTRPRTTTSRHSACRRNRSGRCRRIWPTSIDSDMKLIET